MREYVSGLFLILDSRRYTDDVAFLSISPYEGQQTIVVKGGNRETSRRGKVLDIGNTIKAKLYKRHHFYLTEADIVESFSFLKRNLTTIVLFQILLAVIRHTYYLPERQFFFSVYNSLLEFNQSNDLERAELGLFLLIMKILNYYDVCTFPFICQVCGNAVYEGNYDYLGAYCNEHKSRIGTPFSLFSAKSRIDFLRIILKELLNITVTFNPVTE
jgi:recombinational DNA repair protein (RecF pathway)